jgi:DNA-binding transcriptional LysR family regulator
MFQFMNSLKNVSRLIVFSTVARSGSFTVAAVELGISKSSVSQQVKLLEAELGASLLHRTTRDVSLTPLGVQLLQRCQSLQEQYELVWADVAEAGVSPRGRFALTYPHALESTVVLPAVDKVCQEFPSLEPELVVADHSLDLIANRLDVAVHAGDLPDSGYRALHVGHMSEVFCASPEYLLRNGTPKVPFELLHHSWIATSWQRQGLAVRQIGNVQHVHLPVTRYAQVNTLPSAIELAAYHLGWILVPDVVARPFIKSGVLVHLLPDWTGPNWPVHTLHAYPKEKPIQVERFHHWVKLFFDGQVKS